MTFQNWLLEMFVSETRSSVAGMHYVDFRREMKRTGKPRKFFFVPSQSEVRAELESKRGVFGWHQASDEAKRWWDGLADFPPEDQRLAIVERLLLEMGRRPHCTVEGAYAASLKVPFDSCEVPWLAMLHYMDYEKAKQDAENKEFLARELARLQDEYPRMTEALGLNVSPSLVQKWWRRMEDNYSQDRLPFYRAVSQLLELKVSLLECHELARREDLLDLPEIVEEFRFQRRPG